MLDTKNLRKNLHEIAKILAKKNFVLDTQKFTELDSQRKELQAQTEQLQQQRNAAAQLISQLDKGSNEFIKAIADSKAVNTQLTDTNSRLAAVQIELNNFLLEIPNLPAADVPPGSNEEDNSIIRSWGEIRQFDFAVKDHIQLGKLHDGLDFTQAAKITGSRFVVMHKDIARLHRALGQFMLDLHTEQHGYQETYVPQIVNYRSLQGTSQLPKFADDLFKLEHEKDFYLIPTAEVPLMNLYADTTLVPDNLPLKFTALSSCYRSEAGSYGKDTAGMIRQHQFDKVELVQIVEASQSEETLLKITADAEKVLQLLNLPYRVSMLCGGDLGFAAVQTYDLEVWLPGQNTYREISSCSNCTDFQTRRLNIKIKEQTSGKAHSLNGSGLAIGRTLIAVMENYQQADGSIIIPDAIQKYMGGQKLITNID